MLVIFFFLLEVGRRAVWFGNEFHYPRRWEYHLHGGPPRKMWPYLPSGSLEHVYSHSEEKHTESSSLHWSRPCWKSAWENWKSWQYDSRYDFSIVQWMWRNEVCSLNTVFFLLSNIYLRNIWTSNTYCTWYFSVQVEK